jgi:hypothetical protein
MPSKTCRGLLISLIIFAYLVLPAYAGAHDGVYNYAYNLNGPGGWETHRVDSGFTVRNGVISSNPPALSGSVDSSGNVYFTGPSPYGSPSAVFTGAIYSDGTGKGYYTDSQGLQGAWSVSRVSGSGSDWGNIMMDVMYSFAFIGEIFGFTGGTAAGIGTATVITFFVSIIALASSSKTQAAKRTGQYTATQPDSPQREHGIPPSTIGVPPPPYSPPAGVSYAPPDLPNMLGLKYKWGRNVQLEWSKLKYDKKLYELYGFEVLELRYDGMSTQPYANLVERLSPNMNKWRGRIKQTYQFSTQGDIAGYRVDALFLDKQSPYNQFIRIGETAYSSK